ncbi:Polyisoprenyl-teichoic acid--peptidoglycan teichoic acid transferase TagU [Paraconexibacter sp. AEG42_29]|uniref:Polyisoprenyl-teichoic acid--peptidoglycan teichoic acid transferase TagU n=1 Tax=Paraconexibacter sp. AEG42_29 TaxID=2997339 RepID=A0AAU7ASY1_9ACTN
MISAENSPPRPGFSMVKRMALAATIIFLCTAGAVSSAVLLEIKDDADIFASGQAPLVGFEGEDKESVLDDVDPGGPQTILVLGSDRRFADKKAKVPARSDTMILIRLDPSKGATAVMSIPRDLRVDIPGHGRNKINVAYELGGPVLSVKTIRKLLGVPISHVVNINFGGFQRAVDRLKCVYMDVDRRYFNDNMPPAGGGEPYSVIDVPAGYQRVCGEDALSFVRFRHLDNDLVRAARQQEFLRQAKDQIGLSAIFNDRKTLLRIFGRYTQTDIRGTKAILRLLKLAVESAKNPVQEIQFGPVSDILGTSDLEISQESLDRLSNQFMDAKGSTGGRGAVKKTKSDRERESSQKKKKRRQNSAVPEGLFDAKQAGEDQAIRVATDAKRPLSFPVYYPKLAVLGSAYQPSSNRAYRIRDRGKNSYQAYRIVVSAPGVGQYYGVQGTTWKAPPILDNPSETVQRNGRKLMLFRDGDRLRLVAWRTDKAVYWVSNTLLQSLTNKRMLALADSLTRVGS